jgi:hypothetical protein
MLSAVNQPACDSNKDICYDDPQAQHRIEESFLPHVGKDHIDLGEFSESARLAYEESGVATGWHVILGMLSVKFAEAS